MVRASIIIGDYIYNLLTANTLKYATSSHGIGFCMVWWLVTLLCKRGMEDYMVIKLDKSLIYFFPNFVFVNCV